MRVARGPSFQQIWPPMSSPLPASSFVVRRLDPGGRFPAGMRSGDSHTLARAVLLVTLLSPIGCREGAGRSVRDSARAHT